MLSAVLSSASGARITDCVIGEGSIKDNLFFSALKKDLNDLKKKKKS